LGIGVFQLVGKPYEVMLHGAGLLLVEWLMLFWMYRRKIYLRV
jgi:heparan-alpha-glucosaminide N-acetyltransferase